jgi:hypothetical protein
MIAERKPKRGRGMARRVGLGAVAVAASAVWLAACGGSRPTAAGGGIENRPRDPGRGDDAVGPLGLAAPDAGPAFVMPPPDPERDFANAPSCEQVVAHLVVLRGSGGDAPPATDRFAAADPAVWLDDCRHAWITPVRACVLGAQDLAGAARCGMTP